ncbi:MAG TPA: LysE family transporter [Ferruginibacter sp.]|nr:LysE family transporter [Ferruginibacter sp.]
MTEAILSGLLLGLALVFSVGPVIFKIIKLRINYGLSSAFYFVAGVWFSDFLWILTANLFSGLLGELILYKTIIGTAGSILLISIGVYYLLFKKYHTKAELDQGIKIDNATHIRLLITGFLLNTLNPGVIALWFAATTKTLTNTIDERIITFSICLGINICADIFKIKLAGKLRKNLTDKNITIINKISGFLFLVFGLVLLIGVVFSSLKNK